MRIAIFLVLIVSLDLGNFAEANVSGSSKVTKIINYGSGAYHTGMALSMIYCAYPDGLPACCWCIREHLGAAWQATASFLQATAGERSCDQSSNGGGGCFDTPPPGINVPPLPPPFTPPPYTTSTGGPTGGTTGGTTGLPFPTAIPRPGGLTGGTTGFSPPPPSLNARIPAILAQRPDLKKVLDTLKNNGYTLDFDKGTINTPNGPISASEIGNMPGTSKGANLALELSKELGEKMKKDIEKQMKEAGIEGGGGGGGGPQAPLPGEEDPMKDYMKRMMARMPAQEKNNINGLSVMVNGDPVGIAQGNIFKTIEMRYDKLEQTGMFLGPPTP